MEGRGTEGRSALVDLLAHLRMALGQLRLYPAKSPQALKSTTVAHASLTASLANLGKVTISRTMRGLLVNGKRLPAAGEAAATIEKAWLQILQDAQVNSILFRPAIGLEELSVFLDALGRKFWDLKDGKATNQKLRDSGVFQAQVEEIQFVAVGSGDLVLEGAAAKLEASGARVAEIVYALEQVIDGTTTEGLAEQVRLEIMRKLLNHDPLLIQKAQAVEFTVGGGSGDGGGGSGSGGGGGSRSGPGWISFEQACRSLADIARLLQSAADDQRDLLRELGHRIIGGFRYDPLLSALLKQFLTDEAVDLIPTWMLESEKQTEAPPGPVQRAGEILSLDEERQSEALLAEAAALAKELIALKRPDLVGELVKALTEQARHVAGERRLKAAQTLLQLFPALEGEAFAESRGQIESRILSALALEREATNFARLVDLAVTAVDARLTAGDLAGAIPLLEALRKPVQAPEPQAPERSETAYRALDRIASGRILPVILDRLAAKDPLGLRAAEALDAAAAPFLVEQIKLADGAARRLEIAQMLLRGGARSGSALADEVQRVLAPSEALKLVEVIPAAMSEAQAEETLAALLRHPALAVRRRAASILCGRAFPGAASILLEALRREGETSARAFFVEALGQLRSESAIVPIGQIIDTRSEPDEVRAAACTALGNLGKPQAIPILTRVCVKSRGITKVISSIGPVVRAAAARALSGYVHYGETREALRRALEDKEASVRDAAQAALVAPFVKAFGAEAQQARQVASMAEAEAQDGAFAGFLSEVPLDQICQLVEERHKSGALFLSVGGLIAQIHLERGAVVAADYDGRQDQDAFNQFCRWEGTFFHYTPKVSAPRRGTPESIMKLLLNACEVQGRSERPRTQP